MVESKEVKSSEKGGYKVSYDVMKFLIIQRHKVIHLKEA